MKEFEINLKFSVKKIPGSDDFIYKFFQILKEEIVSILYKLWTFDTDAFK